MFKRRGLEGLSQRWLPRSVTLLHAAPTVHIFRTIYDSTARVDVVVSYCTNACIYLDALWKHPLKL